MIETVITLGILAIIATMSGTAIYQWKQRAQRRNAGGDFFQVLQTARQSAIERGSDVWVIIYPTLFKYGSQTRTYTGRGGYFVFNDPNMEFRMTSSCPTGQICYYNFSPLTTAGMTPTSGLGRLESEAYLDDDYRATQFTFTSTSLTTKSMKGPFANVFDSGCSFCSGNPLKGAIVFNGEGGARFVDGAGNIKADTTAVLGFKDLYTNKNLEFIGITRSTGFIANFPQP